MARCKEVPPHRALCESYNYASIVSQYHTLSATDNDAMTHDVSRYQSGKRESFLYIEKQTSLLYLNIATSDAQVRNIEQERVLHYCSLELACRHQTLRAILEDLTKFTSGTSMVHVINHAANIAGISNRTDEATHRRGNYSHETRRQKKRRKGYRRRREGHRARGCSASKETGTMPATTHRHHRRSQRLSPPAPPIPGPQEMLTMTGSRWKKRPLARNMSA
jgi:hypothetical protein